jgi:Nucleotide modification associated domain 3
LAFWHHWEYGIVNGLLVRVGADQSRGGGQWNGLVDSQSGKFVYVPIPEGQPVNTGMEKPYSILAPAISKFGRTIPMQLAGRGMHLDPDFDHLTYGDTGQRANQLRKNLSSGDFIVFYAGLSDVGGGSRLIYAIIGLYVVHDLVSAISVATEARDCNAHSRRILKPDAQDVIVRARAGLSGRLLQCLPIGEWRNGAYRARQNLLEEWGDLSVKDGYLQRSARLPKFNDPPRFQRWFAAMNPIFVQTNN